MTAKMNILMIFGSIYSVNFLNSKTKHNPRPVKKLQNEFHTRFDGFFFFFIKMMIKKYKFFRNRFQWT